MSFIEWNDKLSVGVQVLDDDHKRMIDMINELYDGFKAGTSKEILDGILAQMEHYTEYHFRHEEELFDQTDYPDAEIHKREHNELNVWSRKTEEAFRNGTLKAPSLEIMNYLKDWLFDHILKSDMNYAPYMKAKRIQ
jgi:hemerythrin-like metal-binding protein